MMRVIATANRITGSCFVLLAILTQAVLGLESPPPRTLTIRDATVQLGQTNTVTIELCGSGIENAVGLSISFDPAVLQYVAATQGSGASGSAMFVNSAFAAAGRLGIALALPTGDSFPVGCHPILAISFATKGSAHTFSTPMTFGDSPVAREVIDSIANTLAASYYNGFFIIQPPPAANAPTVVITGPTSGAEFRSPIGSISLSGLATDDIAITSVTWTSDRAGFGTATGTTNWSIANIPLEPGENRITVTARDNAGNSGADVLIVTRLEGDTVPPLIILTSHRDGQVVGSRFIRLEGIVSDSGRGDSGIASVVFNGVRLPNDSTAAGGQVTWSTLRELEAGLNVFRIATRDSSANANATVLTLVLRYDPDANHSPVIDPVSSLKTLEATPTPPIALHIWDAETASADLIIEVSSSVTSLVPTSGIHLSGTGTNRSLILSPAPNQSGATTIQVMARDADGKSASVEFELAVEDVNSPPEISPLPDLTLGANAESVTVEFLVADAENAADSLKISTTVAGESPLRSEHFQISGSGHQRVLTIRRPSVESGEATVAVAVADESGAVTTRSFKLLIRAGEAPPQQPRLAARIDAGKFRLSFDGTVPAGATMLEVSADLITWTPFRTNTGVLDLELPIDQVRGFFRLTAPR